MYPCVLKIFFAIFYFQSNFFFFWNIFNSKTIKACYIFSTHIQSNPTSSYWFILIKIYYICCILYFRQIISWINTIKFKFILIIFLTGWDGIKKFWLALIVPSPALITPFTVNAFPNILATRVLNIIWRNPPVVFLLYF